MDQMSPFSVRTFWRAASPCPEDLTNPEMVTSLDLAWLMVPSSLT